MKPTLDDLDPNVVAMLAQRAKAQYRKRMQALRSSVPAAARAQRSGQIVARVAELDEFRAARKLALFHPLEQRAEVDVRELVERAGQAAKQVYLPRMPADPAAALVFHRFEGELVEGSFGLLEPPRSAPSAAPGELDLIVVPALAVADTGHRVGYGAGYYDRTLALHAPPAVSVVVAFDFQLVSEVPAAPHDVACHWLVTDKRTQRAASPGARGQDATD